MRIPTDNLIPQSPAPGEPLDALGQRLNLAPTRRLDKKVAAQAEKESWSSGDFLARLLAEEVARGKQTRHEAWPPRKFAPREGSSLAAHGRALAAAVSGKRGKRYLQRQPRLDLGEPAYLDPAEPTARRFAARHAKGAQGGGLQCLLCGALPATLDQEGKAPWGRRQGRLGRKWGHTSGRGAVRSSFLGDPGAKFSCRNAPFRPESKGVKKTGDFGWSKTDTGPADKTASCPREAVGRFWGNRLAVGRFCGGTWVGALTLVEKSSFPEVNR